MKPGPGSTLLANSPGDTQHSFLPARGPRDPGRASSPRQPIGTLLLLGALPHSLPCCSKLLPPHSSLLLVLFSMLQHVSPSGAIPSDPTPFWVACHPVIRHQPSWLLQEVLLCNPSAGTSLPEGACAEAPVFACSAMWARGPQGLSQSDHRQGNFQMQIEQTPCMDFGD